MGLDGIFSNRYTPNQTPGLKGYNKAIGTPAEVAHTYPIQIVEPQSDKVTKTNLDMLNPYYPNLEIKGINKGLAETYLTAAPELTTNGWQGNFALSKEFLPEADRILTNYNNTLEHYLNTDLAQAEENLQNGPFAELFS